MKTPGISFVIPVYNMERYLPRVIQCLKVQTMPGFEAIFVNDGSRDNSLAICKRAASEDPRFRIIDQPNKGVAKARNARWMRAGRICLFSGPGRLGGA